VLTRIPADDATTEFLSQRGVTLDSVPAAGERVFLRTTANLSTGGTSIDRTDEIHPDNVTACEMAAGVVGLDIAGLDVLTPDISRPFHENGAVIIEINAGPGIRMHTHPAEGKPRNVAGAILEMLYPEGTRATIPHNPAPVEGLMDLVRRMPVRRRIGVITAPGDRRDEDLRNVGRCCADLDHVILKEDQNPRGRSRGEVVRIIAAGLADAGIGRDRIEVVLTEQEAVASAVARLGDQDLVVVLVDDVPAVLEQLRALRTQL
jgi:hypothetical protein